MGDIARKVKDIVRNEMTKHLIIFAKHPTPGKVKTRLATEVGATKAAAYQQAFLTTLLLEHRGQERSYKCSIALDDAQTSAEQFATMFSLPRTAIIPQPTGDLGARMYQLFLQGEQRNEQRIIIGADIPSCSHHIIAQAFALMQCYDVVLGPSVDGGYYLIGMQNARRGVFDNVAWSSKDVYAQTRAQCRKHGLSVGRVARLRDIDTYDDLCKEQLHIHS